MPQNIIGRYRDAFYRCLTRFWGWQAVKRMPSRLEPKPVQHDFRLATYCGRRSLKELSMVLFTVYRSFGALPVVRVVLDGSVEKEEMRQALAFWPGPLEIMTWQECAEHHRQRGRAALAVYAEKDVWGRKMAGILATADDGPVLYTDTDVLWFKAPDLPGRVSCGRPVMRMSQDNMHCYHDEFLAELNASHLLNELPRNAGVIYLSGDAFKAYSQLTPILEKISAQPHNRSEQTLFALLDSALGDMWTIEQVRLTLEDRYRLFIKPQSYLETCMARHYSGPTKQLFWMDGMLLLQEPSVSTR